MSKSGLQHPESKQRLAILKRASWAGIVGNLFLSGLKIAAGLFSGSLAVVGDGVDSLSDVATSIVTLYAAGAGSVPPDPEHPWGHGRVETIATKTLSLIIIMAGLQLLIVTVKKLIGGTAMEIPGRIGIWAVAVSIAGKMALAAYKYRAGRITGSQMMNADALNMRNDILLSAVVLTGVLFTRILNLPVIDILAGLGVSIWIVFSGVKIFLRTNTELMDSVEDRDVYRKVFEAVTAVEGVGKPHRVRIRGLNALYVIELDVEVDGRISVSDAHYLACRVEEEIRSRITKIYDIMVHVEPTGVEEHGEGYGLVPEDFHGPNTDSKDN
jgi:cation diffusion facilitator family transporter